MRVYDTFIHVCALLVLISIHNYGSFKVETHSVNIKNEIKHVLHLIQLSFILLCLLLYYIVLYLFSLYIIYI